MTADRAVRPLGPRDDPADAARRAIRSDPRAPGSTLVVVPAGTVAAVRRSVPPETTVRSIVDLADRCLASAGWTVPGPIAHRGRDVVPAPAGAVDPERWLAGFAEARPDHARRLAVVADAADLLRVLDGLLGDGVLPTEGGWHAHAAERVRGDATALDARLGAVERAVPGVDRGAVEAAFVADRDGLAGFARDALESYLGWSLDRDAVTPAQRVAYAAVEPAAPRRDHVVLAGDRLGLAAVDLAAGVADAAVTVLPGPDPPAGVLPAWGDRRDTIARRLGCEPATDGAPRPYDDGIDVRTVPAEDPVEGAVDALRRLTTDGDVAGLPGPIDPGEVVVATASSALARRLMRRGGDLPLARAGPVEVFLAEPALLALAWLRIVTGRRADRGWAVVLERAGCSPGDIAAWLGTDDVPSAFAAVRSDLKRLDDGHAVIAAVVERYGLGGPAAAALQAAVAAGTDGVPSAAPARRAIEAGVRAGHREPLEVDTRDAVRVVAESRRPPSAPAVLHLGGGGGEGAGAIAYAPPLGVRATRSTVEVERHAVAREDPDWATLAAVRAPPVVRRRRILERHLGTATALGVVVGPDAALVDAPALDRRP